MGLSSPGKSNLGRSPFCENYERFSKGNGQDDMQKDVFNIPTMKISPEPFPEPFNNSDGEAEKRKGALNISPKKAPLKTLHERSITTRENQNGAFNIQPKKTLQKQ